MNEAIIDQLKFDDKGLITAVIQDIENKDILMVAYMNKESLAKTVETKKAWFYSRSRQKFWLKGESSGHVQHVQKMFFDCDGDCLVIQVTQEGGACHEGYRTCFFREIINDGTDVAVVGEKIFDPNDVYNK